MNAPHLRDMKESSMTDAERLAQLLREIPDSDGICLHAAAELCRLAAVEAELEALKKAISEAKPVAWTTGIKWHPHVHYESEQVQKLTRKAQPKHGFNTALYTLKGIK